MVHLNNLTEFKYTDVTNTEFLDDIRELSCIHRNRVRWKPGRETRCCAFSSSGDKFAWSPGHGHVEIIHMFTVSQLNHGDSQRERNSITCGCNVTSMKFAPPFVMTENKFSSTSLLATGLENGQIKIWDSNNGHLLFNLSDHTDIVRGLSFSPCGIPLLVSCSEDKTIKVWDLADDGNMTLTVRQQKFPVLDCAFSPVNPHVLASVGMAKMVIVWDFVHKRSCRPARRLRGHNNDVISCSWSPDGALLATASHDTTVIIWDPHANVQITVLCHLYPLPCPIYAGGANGAWVTSVNFSNDGTKIATVCEDNHVRVWKLWNRQDTVYVVPLSKSGLQCRFSPDDQTLAISQLNGIVTLASVPCRKVLSLRHLSRLAARKAISSKMIDLMTLPQPIKDYLAYRFPL
ncbi:WD repeat and SOCS box-containing protein 1-like [Clavelina lepadiformis]|uniref:WD repeat and SOCS box-containing protein 1-like n=1 Tax=Clavelina lepadiformis TaxID=159417 RepID=UPI00404276AF